MKSIITGIALAGLCLAMPKFAAADDQSTGAKIQQPAGATTEIRAEAPTDINKTSKLIGMHVRNQKDQKLGTIRDIAVDYPSQRVAYAVVEKTDEAADTGKYVAIPLNVFTPASDMKSLVLNADKTKFDTAKGFAKNQWPSLALPSSEIAFWQSIAEPSGAQQQKPQ